MSWTLYDRMIDSLPNNILIDEVVSGPSWTMVRAGTRVGCAMTTPVDTMTPLHPSDFVGVSLQQAAACVRSWNLLEASIGMAAINAYYNHPSQEEQIVRTAPNLLNRSGEDAFSAHLEEIKGKKVAVIGHFPHLDSFAEVATLSILERNPRSGDYPDTACEYLLPEQDFVFITGSTLVNKTLPRLLSLAKQAYTVVVGPSTPLCTALLECGVDELNTLIVEDGDACRDIIKTGGTGGALAKTGYRVGLQAG
ncbi:MAG: Rossmann-like domain-containing protein [Oscillospiraceae bacterium]|jgi:uncharacterized protein (DUF4213/DUF364 family)